MRSIVSAAGVRGGGAVAGACGGGDGRGGCRPLGRGVEDGGWRPGQARIGTPIVLARLDCPRIVLCLGRGAGTQCQHDTARLSYHA